MRNKSSIPNRGVRVAEQIQRDLAVLIARDLKDPRLGLITLNEVEVSPDFAHAKVYFSVLGAEPAVSEAALNRAAGRLHAALFKRLRLRTVPALRFIFDSTTEHAAAMDALIARAVASAPDAELDS